MSFIHVSTQSLSKVMAQVNDNSDYDVVWLIVGVLAIIALLIFIIGRFR